MADNQQWFYRLNGQEESHGPVSASQLVDRCKNGDLDRYSRVSTNKNGEWTKAEEHVWLLEPILLKQNESKYDHVITSAINKIDDTIENKIIAPISRKDVWEKARILSAVASGVGLGFAALFISLIGSCISNQIQDRQAGLQELDIFSKYVPMLENEGPNQRAALISIQRMTDTETAIRFAGLFEGEGILDGLVVLYQSEVDRELKDVIRDMIESIMEASPELVAVNDGELTAEQRLVTLMRTETMTRTVPVTRLRTETRTRMVPVTEYRTETRERMIDVVDPETGVTTQEPQSYSIQVPYTVQRAMQYSVNVPYQEQVEMPFTVNVPYTESRIVTFRDYDDPNPASLIEEMLKSASMTFKQLFDALSLKLGATSQLHKKNLRRRLVLLIEEIPGSDGNVRLSANAVRVQLEDSIKLPTLPEDGTFEGIAFEPDVAPNQPSGNGEPVGAPENPDDNQRPFFELPDLSELPEDDQVEIPDESNRNQEEK